MKFDLHVHTNYSDGRLTPCEIVDVAIKKGLSGIAITDHDTLEGIREAVLYSRRYNGFEVIPGIELGCVHDNEEVHILGYFIDYNSNELLKVTKRLRLNRVERGKKIIERLRQMNVGISVDEVQALSKEDFIGRAHIARVLVDKGYASSISGAFEKYLNIDAPAYVARETLNINESISLIKKAGGVSVLAHPGILKERKKIIDYCIGEGIQGIECVHSKHSYADTIFFKNLARENDLLITGGSDCHGEKVGVDLLLGRFYVGEYEISQIKEMV